MPDIPSPSWILLLWCGLAASLAGELVAAVLRPGRGTRRHGEASSPRLMAGPRENSIIAVLTGFLIFAPVYGLLFEASHRADIAAGVIVGAAHGVLAGAIALIAAARQPADARATPLAALAWFRARRLLSRMTFGAVLGFLYAVPGSVS